MTTPETSPESKSCSKCACCKRTVMILSIFMVGVLAGVIVPHLLHCFQPRPPFAMGPGMMHPGMMPGGFRHEMGGPGMGGPGMGGPGGMRRFGMDGQRGGEKGPMGKEWKDYAEKVHDWAKPYDDKIAAVLTPDQKAKFEAKEDRPHMRGGKGPGLVASMIVYQPAVDKMSGDLGLNDKQKASITQIFQQRRQDFLKFIDQNAPPMPPRMTGDEPSPDEHEGV